MTKKELFLRLAQPNNDGVSRWVRSTEFVGQYSDLQLGNGGSWCRGNSSLAKCYVVELDKSLTSGNSIDAVRLNGYNRAEQFSQTIRADIRAYYKDAKCVMLGVAGFSENTKIEIDHKDGRKRDARVADVGGQCLADFQPLCKAANDAKRQICKRCSETNVRWDAQNIKGNPYSFYEGDRLYDEELGCVGCYQYDPVEYRKSAVRRISKEASEYIMERIYNSQE